MEVSQGSFETIDEYISNFPQDVQSVLQELRQAIHEEAPEAKEIINYQMPTFTLHGNLVHFAAYKQHIGFYPTPTGIEAFQDQLSAYKTAKGSVQFPLDEPLPLPLIREIVRYRVNENIQRAAAKKQRKKKT